MTSPIAPPLKIASVSPPVWDARAQMRGDKRGVRLVVTNQPGQYDLRRTQFSSSTVSPPLIVSAKNPHSAHLRSSES
jgi:hypothetical protein